MYALSAAEQCLLVLPIIGSVSVQGRIIGYDGGLVSLGCEARLITLLSLLSPDFDEGGFPIPYDHPSNTYNPNEISTPLALKT